jgi:hypothetical protein
LGQFAVSSLRREPSPPAMITAFTVCCFSRLGESRRCSRRRCLIRRRWEDDPNPTTFLITCNAASNSVARDPG